MGRKLHLTVRKRRSNEHQNIKKLRKHTVGKKLRKHTVVLHKVNRIH